MPASLQQDVLAWVLSDDALCRICAHSEPSMLSSLHARLLIVMGELAVRELERDFLAPGASSLAAQVPAGAL